MYNTPTMKVAIPWGPWIDPARIQPYIDWLRGGGAGVVKAWRVEDLRDCDGLLLPGGPDVLPRYYGEVNRFPSQTQIDPDRDFLEFSLLEEALERDLPILAICRGVQLLNVFLGGSLYQDIPTEYPTPILHRRTSKNDPLPRHPVWFQLGVPERYRIPSYWVEVNSSHHQALRRIAPHLEVGGWAPDGIVEMVWMPGARFVLGVQWHPERDPDCSVSTLIRTKFIEAMER